MHKYSRIVLLLLLALAIPLQGFAAATMLFCAAAKHPYDAVYQHATEKHAHDDGMVHLDHIGPQQAHSHSEAQSDNQSHSSSVHEVAGKCNTCSACCAGVVMLPVPVIEFKPVRGDANLVPIEPQADVAFLTDGPDRPPRTILA